MSKLKLRKDYWLSKANRHMDESRKFWRNSYHVLSVYCIQGSIWDMFQGESLLLWSQTTKLQASLGDIKALVPATTIKGISQ